MVLTAGRSVMIGSVAIEVKSSRKSASMFLRRKPGGIHLHRFWYWGTAGGGSKLVSSFGGVAGCQVLGDSIGFFHEALQSHGIIINHLLSADTGIQSLPVCTEKSCLILSTSRHQSSELQRQHCLGKVSRRLLLKNPRQWNIH